MPHFKEIRQALASRTPKETSLVSGRNSSVALILRKQGDSLEILYILRARHHADPWSGNIGFPGGRIEPGETPREAAERETLEELGVDLGGALFLGRLDDVIGAHLPVVVSCFVYAIAAEPEFIPSDEVDKAFWIPLPCLIDDSRHCEAEVIFGGDPFRRPAIRILPPGEPFLWGLTYRLTAQFLELLGHRIPHSDA